MADWRHLKLETYDPSMNMAIDEAILQNRIDGRVPNTLRLYRWKPSAVSIGKFQDAEKEVHTAICNALGVQVVRRPSGGGTVYHDSEGEITYSVIVNKNNFGTQDLTAIYAKIYAGLSAALRSMGIKADFTEGNAKTCPNMTVGGKKISGSSQCHKRNVVLQHGTLLLDVDFDKMFALLRVPWTDSCMKAARVAENKITSLRTLLKRDVSVQETNRALVAGFSEALGTDLIEGHLTGDEIDLARALRARKYSADGWNLHGQVS